MNNGAAAWFQDNSVHGEDSFLVRELSGTSCLDAVLDGVTQCEGGYASGFTTQVLQDASIESLEDLLGALQRATETLFASGRGRNLLTTVSAVLKLGHELHVVNAGDSPVYLYRDDTLTELTTIMKSVPLPGTIVGAVGLQREFVHQYKRVTLRPGDRLVLATDGLMNNVFPEELADIMRTTSCTQDGITDLKGLVSHKRRTRMGRQDSYVTFREDDQTVIFRYFG